MPYAGPQDSQGASGEEEESKYFKTQSFHFFINFYQLQKIFLIDLWVAAVEAAAVQQGGGERLEEDTACSVNMGSTTPLCILGQGESHDRHMIQTRYHMTIT